MQASNSLKIWTDMQFWRLLDIETMQYGLKCNLNDAWCKLDLNANKTSFWIFLQCNKIKKLDLNDMDECSEDWFAIKTWFWTKQQCHIA